MKLFRFRYSPYARKVQAVLDLLGITHEIVDVPYGDRSELARVSGGVSVPVLIDDAGLVIVDSRAICEHLLVGIAAARLVPPPWEGPIWAYADFCDGPLEDVLFRYAAPAVRDAWGTPHERAMYTFVKERKFGTGCVDAWERDRETLVAQARRLLEPTVKTLAARPFLFGDTPTLADAALYGNSMMLLEADAALLLRFDDALASFVRRMDDWIVKARTTRDPAPER